MNNDAVMIGSSSDCLARSERATGRRQVARYGLAALGLVAALGASADPIAIPNGDFSDPANDGSIGGLIGVDINNVPIGAGPWHGSAYGILGLLAQPTLTIDSATLSGTISGLLGIDVAGLLNNGGSFRQELSQNYTTGMFYVLRASITTSVPLSLPVLAGANTGIGFMANNVELESSTTAAPSMTDLQIGEGGSGRVSFGYWADIAASGPIGIRLFNEPQDLLTASLLGTVSFANVTLEERDVGDATDIDVGIDPGPDGPDEAPIGQPYAGEFIAIIRDAEGDGVPGFEVVISAPEEGASADLSSPTSVDPPGRTIIAVSDVDGIVSFDAVANELAGCFQVTVNPLDPELSVTQAVFYMRNISGDLNQNSIFCNSFEQ
jgi:hypothetical protein